ncbi:MAG TPA: acyltransferase [Puia sp.]|nr:acyltransferase [Puia sp.]
MSPVSFIPILPVLAVALFTLHWWAKILGIRPAEGKFAPIDGLRGYMAFFVFLHHSCIWYFMTHGYGWGFPPSYLYRHFGPTSVAVFFMITSFLFFSKLLEARAGEIDWIKLYIGRCLRILPLYLVAVFILILIVAIHTGFTLHEPLVNVLWEITQWLLYIQVDINGLTPTWLINAYVFWSLPYEWLFYFMLPFLGLLTKIRASHKVLFIALAGGLFFFYAIVIFQTVATFKWLLPFLSGLIAAYLSRSGKIRDMAAGPMASFLIIISLYITVAFFPDAHGAIPLLLLSFSFITIACGNTLFGALTHSLSRTLGQISYSIYLLHGIILFIAFKWVIGFRQAGSLSPLEHWFIILFCSVAVILVCGITYRFIERPAQKAAPTVYNSVSRLGIGHQHTSGKRGLKIP